LEAEEDMGGQISGEVGRISGLGTGKGNFKEGQVGEGRLRRLRYGKAE
jgi:hypothetical protein